MGYFVLNLQLSSSHTSSMEFRTGQLKARPRTKDTVIRVSSLPVKRLTTPNITEQMN